MAFGDCLQTCDLCPYEGHTFDRKLLIANMPLAAARKRYLDIKAHVIRFVEAARHEPPIFVPWSRDPQPIFWRRDNTSTSWAKNRASQVDWEAVKSRFDLRTEWEAYYGAISEPTKNPPKTYCPFHSERHPSMALYSDGFHCFGCQVHGDVIDVLIAAGKLGDAIGSTA